MTRKEVYKGLEQADVYFRSSFDAMYGTFACEKFRSWTDAIEYAIALLKAQEPRVMALEELRMNEVYWAEQENVSRPWPIAMHHIRNAGLLDGPVYQDYMGDNFNTKEYGKKWRCWTSRPTQEQMEATPWN